MNQNLEKYLSEIEFKVLVEEHKFQNMQFIEAFCNAFTTGLKQAYGSSLKNNFFYLKGDYMKWAVDMGSYNEMAPRYLNLVKTKPDFAVAVNKELFSAIAKCNIFSNNLLLVRFADKQNTQLFEYCEEQRALLYEMIIAGMLAPMMETSEPLYTNFLTALLNEKAKLVKVDVAVSEAVAVLTSFEGMSESKREQIELLKLAKKVKMSKNIGEYSRELDLHCKTFGWILYNYSGPGWAQKEYADSLLHLFSEDAGSVDAKLNHFQGAEAKLTSQIKFFEDKFQLNETEKKFFSIARDFMKGKALRKEAMFFAAYASEPLFREIGRRLNLSLIQARLLTLDELKEALLTGKTDEAELSKRAKSFVFGFFDNRTYRVLATGSDAEKYLNLVKEVEISRDVLELSGTCACTGKASGVVKIVNLPSDVAKMKKGDILVSISTTPDLVHAMRLASAIVTDSGGLTSHAAIVSRELNVPCVIGTKIATKWLKDGDKVEVDAGKGTVKLL